MYLLIQSKVTINRALILAGGMITFIIVKQAVSNLVPLLVNGKSLADSMAEQTIFIGRVKTMISVGESVNKLEDAFDHLSNQLRHELEFQNKLINNVLEPVLIVLVALIVGFILISMYLPLFNLSSAIG